MSRRHLKELCNIARRHQIKSLAWCATPIGALPFFAQNRPNGFQFAQISLPAIYGIRKLRFLSGCLQPQKLFMHDRRHFLLCMLEMTRKSVWDIGFVDVVRTAFT